MFTVNEHLRVGPSSSRRVPDGFELRPYERLTLTPLSPTIGAEVEGFSLADRADASMLAELRQALLEWKVLFFRDQDITRAQQRQFAEMWGPLEQHPFYSFIAPDQDDEDVVRLAKDAASSGVENGWHADVTWCATPSMAAVLRAVEVPDVGGDTLFADAGLAYDELDPELQQLIDPLVAVNDWTTTFGVAMPDADRERLRTHFPEVHHPVVRVHPETGRRTLFVNAFFTTRILDMEPDRSDQILGRLFAQFHRPEFQCRFRWQTGSVAFWDNRAVQHYAVSDYFPNRRVMDRISIAGDVPAGIT